MSLPAMGSAKRRGLLASLGVLVLALTLTAPLVPAAAAGTVSISGVIVDSAGVRAAGQNVAAYLPDGGAGWGKRVSATNAAADGTFRLTGLEAGRKYRLRTEWSDCCAPENLKPSFSGFATKDPVNSMTREPALAGLFTPGTSGLTGVTFRLEPSTVMTGRVVRQDGTPLAGVELDILAHTTQRDIYRYGSHVFASQAVSKADGTFRATGLEYLGSELLGHFVRVTTPNGHQAFVGSDTSGLVPVDQARIFAKSSTGTSGVKVMVPNVKRPVEQVVLGRPLTATGDRYGEIIAVGSGTLSVFSLSRSTGKVGTSYALRTGFGDEQVYAPGDWGGVARDWLENENPAYSHFEYYDDLVSVDTRGDMWLYEGDGHATLRKPKRIGWGWSGYRVIPVGDVSGDYIPDLLAIDRDGYLKLYRGDGKGGFLYPYPRIGNGWKGFDLYSAGDLNRDGRNDILSVDSSGRLWMYAGNGVGSRGNGTFAMRKQVGSGWGAFTVGAGADIDGYYKEGYGDVNGAADIVGRKDATGELFLFSGRGDGGFKAAKLIATGW